MSDVTKTAVRAQARSARQTISDQHRDEHQRRLLRLATQLSHLAQDTRCIAAFLPMSDEIDLLPCLQELQALGNTMMLPVVGACCSLMTTIEDAHSHDATRTIINRPFIGWRYATSEDLGVQQEDPRACGCKRADNDRQPAAHVDQQSIISKLSLIHSGRGDKHAHQSDHWLPAEALRQASLILVPALAMDLQGVRVGRGGGWYDRALQYRTANAITIGVCWDWEISGEPLPHEPHDIALDAFIHPSRLWWCQRFTE